MFGGSFDPIHHGHIHVIEEVAKLNLFKTMIIIPNFQSPHKPQPYFEWQERLKKVQESLPIFSKKLTYEVCDWEIRQKKPCWTIDTLRRFVKEYKESSLYFIMGSDSFFNFHTWHEYQQIAALVSVIVVKRDHRSKNEYDEYQKRYCPSLNVIITENNVVDISSTQLRKRVS